MEKVGYDAEDGAGGDPGARRDDDGADGRSKPIERREPWQNDAKEQAGEEDREEDRDRRLGLNELDLPGRVEHLDEVGVDFDPVHDMGVMRTRGGAHVLAVVCWWAHG